MPSQGNKNITHGSDSGRLEDEIHGEKPLLGAKSPGVRRIEALSTQFTTLDRVFISMGVFLIAYAYGLDGSVRYTYQVWPSLACCKVLEPTYNIS